LSVLTLTNCLYVSVSILSMTILKNMDGKWILRGKD
jgi:hypothetical protein